jgi:hypothetical protein
MWAAVSQEILRLGCKFLNINVQVKGKVVGKAMPAQAWTRPEGPRRMRCQNLKTIST